MSRKAILVIPRFLWVKCEVKWIDRAVHGIMAVICLTFVMAVHAQNVPNEEERATVHRIEKIKVNASGVSKESRHHLDNAPSNVWEWPKESVVIAQPTSDVPLSAVITPPLDNGATLAELIQWSASGGTVSIPNASNANHENAIFNCPATAGLYRVTAKYGNVNGASSITIAIYVAPPRIKDVTYLNSIQIRRDRVQASFGMPYTGINWRDDDLDGESDMGKAGSVDADIIANGNENNHSNPVAYYSKGGFSASINLCPYVAGSDNGALVDESNQLVFNHYDVAAAQCKPVVSWIDSNGSHNCIINSLEQNGNYNLGNAMTVSSSGTFRSQETTGYESQFQLKCEVGFGRAGVPQEQLVKFQSSSTNELYLLFRYNSEIFNTFAVDTQIVFLDGIVCKVDNAETYNYESIFHIGCTRANGKTTVSQIIDSIWGEFTDRVVQKKGSTSTMKYCGSLTEGNDSVSNYIAKRLLFSNDGRCSAWADLFKALLVVQGISEDIIFKNIIYHNGTTIMQHYGYNSLDKGFMIKNYSFNSNGGTSGNSMYPFLFIGADNECTDLEGIPAQGNANPCSVLVDHVLIITNGLIYDPSYGMASKSLLEYRNNNIAGWFTILDDNGIARCFATDSVDSHQLKILP